jgi:hypothetical protein
LRLQVVVWRGRYIVNGFGVGVEVE